MAGHYDSEVVIIGGGPVGLALAAELGWRGLSCILLEQTDGIVTQPKMDGIDLRVMEFCRRWGIVDQMREYGFPENYPQDMVYVTSLNGYELGRESFASPAGGPEMRHSAPSPESRIRCPQTHFDPILQRLAKSFPTVQLRFHAAYETHTQDDDGVTVNYRSADGASHTLRSRYMVGCDGANSVVRKQLDIPFTGVGHLNYTTNVLFHCKDLFAYNRHRPGYRWLFIGTEGVYATLSTMNGKDLWRAQLFNDERKNLTEDEARSRLERMVGQPFDCEIRAVLHWSRRELVAESYRQGRVFLAGDAAHATSPTGGFGMNTGIKDAVDLAWKIDATLKGWGGDKLLDSYDLERRPMGKRAVREATGNWFRMNSTGAHPNLLEPNYEGALLRHEVGRRYSATMLREWYKLGIDLGYVYRDSPICVPDVTPPDTPAMAQASQTSDGQTAGTAPDTLKATLSNGKRLRPSTIREWQRLIQHEAEGYTVKLDWQELPTAEVMVYLQSTEPGARAPHVWLDNGSSTLDWFGRDFVLLKLSLAEQAHDDHDLVAAAHAAGLPLRVITCTEAAVREEYAIPYVLVRPDGHVAWRGASLPVGRHAQYLVNRVRGA